MYCFKQFLAKDVVISPLIFNKEYSLSEDDIVTTLNDRTSDKILFIEGNGGEDNYKIILHKYKIYYKAGYHNYYYPLDNPSYLGGFYIPYNFIGEKIHNKSLELISNGNTLEDDGEGNILHKNNDDAVVGCVIYNLGLVILFEDLIDHEDIDINFNSTLTIIEHQYKCVIRPTEFKFSQNPSTHVLGNIAQEEYFSPYITTVGLYNDNKELLAVAKTSQPIPPSKHLDTTIIIKFDG